MAKLRFTRVTENKYNMQNSLNERASVSKVIFLSSFYFVSIIICIFKYFFIKEFRSPLNSMTVSYTDCFVIGDSGNIDFKNKKYWVTLKFYKIIYIVDFILKHRRQSKKFQLIENSRCLRYYQLINSVSFFHKYLIMSFSPRTNHFCF